MRSQLGSRGALREYGNASHGVAIDSQHRVYITHNGNPGSLFVFDADGRFIRAMGEVHNAGPAAKGHGISFREDGGEEFLYLAPADSEMSFTKMSLTGEVVWVKNRETINNDSHELLSRNEFGFFARLKSVTELMITQVPVISSEVGDVVGRKDPSTLNSFAVIDSAKGDLIGLLKHSTILRCLPRYLNTLKESDRDRSILTTNVCDLVSRQSPSLSPSATLLEALEILVRQD